MHKKWNLNKLVQQSLDAGDNCILFKGAKTSAGYGQIFHEGKVQYLHRVIYEKITNSKIPFLAEIDHTCRIEPCFSFKHLEVVTSSINKKRRRKYTYFKKTHCNYGHEFTPENTRITSNNSRCCKICDELYSLCR